MKKQKLSNEFDTNFQIKAITAICTDADFLDRTADILDPEFFDGDSKQWIIKRALEFHSEYQDRPTPTYFRKELKNVASDSTRASIVNTLRKMKSKRESPDLDYVKDHFLEFCKEQKVKNTIEESVDLLKTSEGVPTESIQKKMDEALSAGMRKDVGHDYMEEAKERMNEPARDTIGTGYPVLDGEVLDGGLSGGEIGVFMGYTGVGKCVGEDTEIEIEYEQIGIEAGEITAWFDPWEVIETSTGKLTAWEVGKILEEEDIDL